jgi:hypothetical protein
MDITRETVLKWLEDQRRSHTWLAEQCGKTIQAVSNWLREKNPQAISASAKITIAKLMAEDAAANEAKPPHSLVLEFNDDDYESIENAALRSNKSIRNWAKDTLVGIADVDVVALAKFLGGRDHLTIYTQPEEPISKIAENEIPYRVHSFEIPLLRAAAGFPIIADAEIVEVEKDYGQGRFLLELRGDSMEPQFNDRQRVVLRDKSTLKRPVLKYGEFYAFVHNGSTTFKMWAKDKSGNKVLRSLNPEHADIPADENTDWIGWFDAEDNQ